MFLVSLCIAVFVLMPFTDFWAVFWVLWVQTLSNDLVDHNNKRDLLSAITSHA